MAYLVRLTWESLNLQLSHTLNDKLEFYKFCQKYDLSTAPVLAHCSDSNTVVMLAPTAELKRDLMLKFTNSAASEGVELIAWDGTTNEWRHQNASITESQLMDLLRTKSLGRSAILQPGLFNHSVIRSITREGLSTTRILTAAHPRSSDTPCVASAAVRISTGAVAVDNMVAGGIGSAVNIEKGTLGLGVGKSVTKGWYNNHPESGVVFEGLQLPFWREACELCVRAHSLARDIPVIGWDVGILENGPVLIEANLGWDSDIVQLSGTTALGETAAAAALRHFLLPTDRQWQKTTTAS